jgi:hypothetical protein
MHGSYLPVRPVADAVDVISTEGMTMLDEDEG